MLPSAPPAAPSASALAGPLQYVSLLGSDADAVGGCPCCVMRSAPVPAGPGASVPALDPAAQHRALIEQALANVRLRQAAGEEADASDDDSVSESSSSEVQADADLEPASTIAAAVDSLPTHFGLIYLPAGPLYIDSSSDLVVPESDSPNQFALCPYTRSVTYAFATRIDATECWQSSMENRHKLLDVLTFPGMFLADLIKQRDDRFVLGYALHTVASDGHPALRASVMALLCPLRPGRQWASIDVRERPAEAPSAAIVHHASLAQAQAHFHAAGVWNCSSVRLPCSPVMLFSAATCTSTPLDL